jgi:4-hydroxybenzoate polyprenyltransferase
MADGPDRRAGEVTPSTRAPIVRAGGALLTAAHIEPSVAVTLAATALALSVGLGATSALVALAVGSGQLSIGWSNDWLDWRRDRAAGRRDKPVAQRHIGAGTVRTAAFAALAVCVVSSLALGVAAGVVHLVAVAAGWAYNLRAKHTPLSVAPWALAFGLLPAVVTLTPPVAQWPAPWVMIAGALLGSGAHFANTIPDLAADRATGVHGLPHRLGRRRSLITVIALVGVGVAVVVAGLAPGIWAWATAVVGGLLLAGVAWAALAARDRLAFRGVVALLLLLALGVFASGPAIV